jgi:hypothetical protein
MNKKFEYREWYYFVQNYLKISELACLEMTSHRYTRFCRYKPNQGKILSEFHINDLYISTIYNIKHSIEIAIKTLSGLISDRIKDNTHNIKELFLELKKIINIDSSANKIIKIFSGLQERYQKNNTKITKLTKANSVKNIKEHLDQNLKDFEALVLKYQQCEFIKNKINDLYIIEDFDNTAFRYPCNSMEIQLNYEKIINKINENDIYEILDDIKKLKVAFDFLHSVLFVSSKIKINKPS